MCAADEFHFGAVSFEVSVSERCQVESTRMCVFLCLMKLPLFQAQNRGIVMVAFYTYFVSCNDTATIRDVVGKCCGWSFSLFLSLIESPSGALARVSTCDTT